MAAGAFAALAVARWARRAAALAAKMALSRKKTRLSSGRVGLRHQRRDRGGNLGGARGQLAGDVAAFFIEQAVAGLHRAFAAVAAMSASVQDA